MKKNLPAFTQQLRRNPELERKFDAITAHSKEELATALVALTVEAGTPVSVEEWTEALASEAALPDSNLEEITGGIASRHLYSFGTYLKRIKSFLIAQLPEAEYQDQ